LNKPGIKEGYERVSPGAFNAVIEVSLCKKVMVASVMQEYTTSGKPSILKGPPNHTTNLENISLRAKKFSNSPSNSPTPQHVFFTFSFCHPNLAFLRS
jgi:hypothetical protein